jgi:hypothetical protein
MSAREGRGLFENVSGPIVACSRAEALIMIRNVGTIDRAVRVVLGIALLSLIFIGPHSWLGLIGLVPLLTGLFGFCPLYRVLGLRTRPEAHA